MTACLLSAATCINSHVYKGAHSLEIGLKIRRVTKFSTFIVHVQKSCNALVEVGGGGGEGGRIPNAQDDPKMVDDESRKKQCLAKLRTSSLCTRSHPLRHRQTSLNLDFCNPL